MRELKFRVYGGLLKKEFKAYDNVLIQMHDGELKIKPYDWHGRGDDVVVEQFTGLKDKNGKEIYEGDIITDKDSCGEVWVAEVIYDEVYAQFTCEAIGKPNCWSFEEAHLDELEVIGNIHENPELCGEEE